MPATQPLCLQLQLLASESAKVLRKGNSGSAISSQRVGSILLIFLVRALFQPDIAFIAVRCPERDLCGPSFFLRGRVYRIYWQSDSARGFFNLQWPIYKLIGNSNGST